MSQQPFLPGQTTRPGPGERPSAVGPDRVEERALYFGGFRYTCRIVHQGRPVADPVVILGGSSQDRYSWVRHERWLAEIATVVTVDLPGYGDSEFLPSRHGMDFLAEAVRHLLVSLGLTRVNLIGACFGGAIATRLAQSSPDRLSGLVLVGMARQLPQDYAEIVDRWRGEVAAGQLTAIADELVNRFTAHSTRGVVRKLSAVTRLLRRDFLGLDRDGLEKWLEHNARLVAHDWYRAEAMPVVPTLVVTGEHDVLTPPAEGRALATTLPSAWFTTLREADHLAPVERVGEFAELVSGFFTGSPWYEMGFCGPVESFGSATRSSARTSSF